MMRPQDMKRLLVMAAYGCINVEGCRGSRAAYGGVRAYGGLNHRKRKTCTQLHAIAWLKNVCHAVTGSLTSSHLHAGLVTRRLVNEKPFFILKLQKPMLDACSKQRSYMDKSLPACHVSTA